jgi:outer membrane lipoprotein SlyB
VANTNTSTKEIIMLKQASIIAGILTTGLLSACSSGPDYIRSEPASYGSSYSSYSAEGRVTSIDYVGSRSTSGGGAIIGGIVGGVLGHQIGSGRGNDAATVAGAVGGAIVGNEMEKRRSSGGYYSITVRAFDGSTQTFNYENVGDLRVGDRVRIEGGYITRF